MGGATTLTFLGTGTSQGVPMIGCNCPVCRSVDVHDKRLRSSVLVQTQNVTLLIDCGPDFRQQMLCHNIAQIDAILFTHEHKDHTGGLDDVRALNYFMQAPIPVYAENRVMAALQRDYAYVFKEHQYPGAPQVEAREISTQKFTVKGVEIQPVRVMHGNLPILGFRVGELVYLTDTNFVSDESKALIQGCKVLIINGVRKESHVSHFSLSQALQLITEVAPAQAYITHISHQLGLHHSIQAALPPQINLAYDGLQVVVE
ncbi:hydrolase [Bacteroidia bacterium]|nr:hydrolase [Bacteroidia bacterium]